MAGDHKTLRQDQAMERWAAMRENVHLYWRPRVRSALPLIMLTVGVPVGLYYALVWGFDHAERRRMTPFPDMWGRTQNAEVMEMTRIAIEKNKNEA